MRDQPATGGDPAEALLALYDRALPQVYGYLLHRCGGVAVAEDLTAETFLAAAAAVHGPGRPPPISTPWLIGVARHKLVDHWRRAEREQKGLVAVAGEPERPEDPWDARLDAATARDTLEQLGAHHRAALTLRYLDDLPVAEVATILGRTVHATEALLVRARSAFRRHHTGEEASDA
jgi:RNA polymerase sigma-70 factor (ECF subfamily)